MKCKKKEVITMAKLKEKPVKKGKGKPKPAK
jgi:hypothetical protein